MILYRTVYTNKPVHGDGKWSVQYRVSPWGGWTHVRESSRLWGDMGVRTFLTEEAAIDCIKELKEPVIVKYGEPI